MNDPKNVVGVGELMMDEDEDMTTIAQLEKEIMEGAQEETDANAAAEYEKEIASLTKNFDKLSNNGAPFDAKQGAGGASMGLDLEDTMETTRSPSSSVRQDQPWKSQDPQLKKMTIEEQKQAYVDKVLSFVEDKENNFDVEQERDEDEKIFLLEQIDTLRDTLDDDGINIENVPKVNKNSSLSEINAVYKSLNSKNDRSRNCSLANEIILFAAGGLEEAFDGKRQWFGYTPDLTGWSDTVKIKLRRMRYETSTLVQEVMQKYQIGPGWRLFLELVPSLFTYSKNRRLKAKDNLISDGKFQLDRDAQQAISEINNKL